MTTLPEIASCYFREKKVDVSGILRVKGWTTPTKTRFLAGWAHTVGQQVLRVDYEPSHPSAKRPALASRSCSLKKCAAPMPSPFPITVLASPLPKPSARPPPASKREIPITLDSRYQVHGYKHAGITSATPNEAEMESLHHTTIGSNLKELERCGESTREELKLKSLLVTRGRDGMALFQPGHKPLHIFAHGTAQAVDVTGAGDTVLAVYTLGLASGASPLEAAQSPTLPASLVVMKRGTATVSREEASRSHSPIRRQRIGLLMPSAILPSWR